MTLEEQLIRDEGLRLKPYRDTMGKLTIGIGRNLDDKGITVAEAKFLLKNDINDCERLLEAAMPWASELDYPRYAVLLNMCFNLGINGLLGFKKTLVAIRDEDWEAAAAQMLDSRWHQQTGKRAERLANQMKTGQWT